MADWDVVSQVAAPAPKKDSASDDDWSVVSTHAGANVPTPKPRWDILGDAGRAAAESYGSLKTDASRALTAPKSIGDEVGREVAMGKTALDAMGVALSPLTGGLIHGVGGSAIAAAIDHNPGMIPKSSPYQDPKDFADRLAELGATAGPGGGEEAEAILGGKGGSAPPGGAPTAPNTLKAAAAPTVPANVVANLKPGALEARAAGYVLPPTAALDKPGVANSLASGWGGKIKLQQGASSRNQEVTNGLAATDLGLPKDTVLTDKVFKQVRQGASKAYKAVAQAVPEMAPDPTFQTNIAALGGRNSAAGQQFPGVIDNPELDTMISNMGKVQKFTPDAGLEVVRKLRSDAKKNIGNQDPNKSALGIAQRKAADEIDDLMEREIARQAPAATGLIKEYKGARQLMAKSYDVEGATNTATGDVSAKGLARLASRGKPMSGNLKTIADTANAFPKAMQNPAAFGGDEPYSALDAFAAAGSVAAGKPEAALTILGRPLVRNALLSKAYQDRMIPTGVPAVPPPQTGLQLVHNAPLPGVQNQLAQGIFRAAHVAGLRSAIAANTLRNALSNQNAPQPVAANGQ